MATLTLALKGEYFDAIKAGIKPEEFRLLTPYWRKRLEGCTYDCIELTKGYPARGDQVRRLSLPWRGYRITTITHPHFGSEPVEVFAINVKL
ncbi:ASCH domain-containing protein [Pseudomonas asuensis]|nr:ASCH domain-containing protein [Pseudomonas asuensis]